MLFETACFCYGFCLCETQSAPNFKQCRRVILFMQHAQDNITILNGFFSIMHVFLDALHSLRTLRVHFDCILPSDNGIPSLTTSRSLNIAGIVSGSHCWKRCLLFSAGFNYAPEERHHHQALYFPVRFRVRLSPYFSLTRTLGARRPLSLSARLLQPLEFSY